MRKSGNKWENKCKKKKRKKKKKEKKKKKKKPTIGEIKHGLLLKYQTQS